MNRSESQLASEKLARLKADFGLNLLMDWGSQNPDGSGESEVGTWSMAELDKLHGALTLLSNFMGGAERFIENLGEVMVKRANIGTRGGEARIREVTFSTIHPLGAWAVVHEFAHVWDGNHGWGLSRRLEKYTGGFTSLFFASLKKFFGSADLNGKTRADEPGRRGRRPGCNARGYFYGDKPSGSDWNFNRVEDFAESVAMYIGWNGDNALTGHAHARLSRYLLANGETDPFFHVKDNWADYKKYFYPEVGDYTKTKRWKFVEGLARV